jgi:hypothetical protein
MEGNLKRIQRNTTSGFAISPNREPMLLFAVDLIATLYLG